MNGKIAGGTIVIAALIAGFGVWYANEEANFAPVDVTSALAEMRLVSVVTGQSEPIISDAFQGISGDSSPLRFRSCFTTPLSLALLTETYQVYESPTPLIAPARFTCFDAKRIGADLETGAAVAFLSEAEIFTGVDRVIAVYPDGRAFAWNQLNEKYAE